MRWRPAHAVEFPYDQHIAGTEIFQALIVVQDGRIIGVVSARGVISFLIRVGREPGAGSAIGS